jgi:hypothetical protein
MIWVLKISKKLILGKKMLAVLLFLGIGLTTCLSQSPSMVNNKVAPAPPEVAALIKVADIPVSNYTGTSQFSIPIANVNLGDLQLPVSISYYSRGLRVNEEASWVGLGWSLNAGGVIHESIVGEKDSNIDYAQLSDAVLANGTTVAYAIKPSNMPEPCEETSPVPIEIDNWGVKWTKHVNRNTKVATYYNAPSFRSVSHEPDLFIFNFGNWSGKFFKNNNGEWVVIDKTDFKITQNTDDSFTIIAPDGVKYDFGFIQVTKPITYTETSGTGLIDNTYRSWHLTKITTLSGRTAVYSYKQVAPRTYPEPGNAQDGKCRSVPVLSYYIGKQDYYTSASPNPEATAYDLKQSSSFTETANTYLEQINFGNGKIQFFTEGRNDMMNGLLLKQVEVSYNNNIVNRTIFGYDYFVGNSNYGDWITDPAIGYGPAKPGNAPNNDFYPGITDEIKRKRLKLNSVTTNGITHSFEYDVTPLPYKTSLAKDVWGYFNGAQNNKNTIPDFNKLGYYDNDLPNAIRNNITLTSNPLADRKVFPQVQKAGLLTKINYPTGGYAVMEYEPNKIDYMPIGTTPNITNKTVSVTDIGVGQQKLEFDIEYIPIANTGTIEVYLFCSSGSPCSSCTGYQNYANSSIPNGPPNITNGFYALLEKWNATTSSWELTSDNIFDFSSTVFNGTTVCIGSVSRTFTAGKYRITANYPDNLPEGHYGSQMSRISVTYKGQDPNDILYGDGLRIKSIKYYENATKIARSLNYQYSSGRLLWKPIFYRYLEGTASIFENVITPTVVPGSCVPPMEISLFLNCASTTPCEPAEVNHYEMSVYSNPTIDYSYAPSGAMTGYDEVTITEDNNNQQNGKTKYTYFNDKPKNIFYEFMPPGMPVSVPLTNGKEKQIDYYKQNELTPKQTVTLEYITSKEDKYWNFKSAFIDKYVSVGGGVSNYQFLEGFSQSWRRVLVNYYKLRMGKVLLSKKTTILNENGQSLNTVTDYTYNNNHQLSSESTTDSKGQKRKMSYIYAGDFPNTTTGIIGDMKSRNILSYPIEQWQQLGTLTTDAQYNNYNITNNIFTLQSLDKLNTNKPVSFTNALTAKDSRYVKEMDFTYDGYGNLIMQQKRNDLKESYIWGYGNNYPVAKIVGSDYTTAVQYVNTTTLNNASSGSDDNVVRTELNKLHTGLAGLVSTKAFATTYTYNPLIGISSVTDANKRTNYYVYDGVNRLTLIRDQDNNIVKKVCYKYNGQPEPCTVNYDPEYQPTGATRCEPCAANTAYTTGTPQEEVRDVNPLSSTYNTITWIYGGQHPNCMAAADWQNTTTPIRCQKNASNQNTGYQEQEQRDMNPCSSTGNTTRWVNIGQNLSACPLPVSTCTSSNCVGNDKKCVNNVCETGVRVFTQAGYNPSTNSYICTYHYEFSDGSWSQNYELITSPGATSCY